jgi:hypothetical protein
MSTKRGSIPKNEQRVKLHLWTGNGQLAWHDGQGPKGHMLHVVSIGRTDSELGLGFTVSDPETGTEMAAFVLDRAQVENLGAFLRGQVGRLKKSKGPDYLNFAALERRLSQKSKRGPR